MLRPARLLALAAGLVLVGLQPGSRKTAGRRRKAADADRADRQPERPAAPAASSLPIGEGFDFYVLSLSWSPSYCEAEGRGGEPPAMRDGAALRLRRPRPVAAIRARLPRELPDGRAGRLERDAAHALRPDAVGRPDPPSMAQARLLLRSRPGRLFRRAARCPRDSQHSRRIPPPRRLPDARS